MNLEQIKELIASLEASKLKRLAIKQGDFELQLEKEDAPPLHPAAHLPSHYNPPRLISAEPAAVEQSPLPKQDKPAGRYVTSPMVGTFYATPSPDQPSFVKVGDRVSEDTVVCIVEAMKVMNEVRANMSGTVAEILIDNAQPVEFGTKIFRIV